MSSPTSTDRCERCTIRPVAAGRPFAYYCDQCRRDLFLEPDARRRLARLEDDYGRSLREPFTIDENNAAAVAACVNWWRTPTKTSAPGGLFIHGPVGTGKSTLAFEIAREWCLGDEHARLVVVRDLLAKSRRAMNDADDEARPIDDLIDDSPDLLVLDDVGAERPTDWAVEEIARLVEARYRGSFINTIVTSNYSPAKLAARLGRFDTITGHRIVSRLRENVTVIHLPGPDRRVAERAA